MKLELFDFDLPPELIAQTPAASRDASRLMLLERGKAASPQHHHFQEIQQFLQPGDLLVLNNTKVFPARVVAHKETGGKAELLLVEALEEPCDGVGLLHSSDKEHSNALGMAVTGNVALPDKDVVDTTSWLGTKFPAAWAEVCAPWVPGEVWHVLAKANRPLRPKTWLQLPEGQAIFVEGRYQGGYRVVLHASLKRPQLYEYLERVGQMPLPPYIDPKHGQVDHRQRYQTVFAQNTGAVAAPTAGLHFTPALLEQLKARGVRIAELTLHVGLGTFLPVRVDDIQEHQMHAETYDVPESTVELWRQTKAEGGRVIAVGTTSLRALEAASQRSGSPESGSRSTSIFIYPGYEFRAVDGLLTNFHLPQSTLLMLVSALYGHERMMQAYRVAVEQGYRFYSYGDAMLIL